MKKIFFLSMYLVIIYSVSGQNCNSLRSENENYGSGDNYISWCEMNNQTDYTKCMCEREKTQISTTDNFKKDKDDYNKKHDRLYNLAKSSASTKDYKTAVNYAEQLISFIKNSNQYQKESSPVFKKGMLSSAKAILKDYTNALNEKGENSNTKTISLNSNTDSSKNDTHIKKDSNSTDTSQKESIYEKRQREAREKAERERKLQKKKIDNFNKFKENQSKQEAVMINAGNNVKNTLSKVGEQIFAYDEDAYFARQNRIIERRRAKQEAKAEAFRSKVNQRIPNALLLLKKWENNPKYKRKTNKKRKGEPHGYQITYYDMFSDKPQHKKEEGFRIDGSWYGEWKVYYKTGELMEIVDYISNDRQFVQSFYKTGELKSIEDFTYKDIGKKGLVKMRLQYSDYTEFRKNKTILIKGRKKGALFTSENRLEIGEWKSYYENGEIASIKKYAENDESYGRHNGNYFYKAFYKNGNVKSEGTFVNDKQEGNWKYYFENGEIKNNYSKIEQKKLELQKKIKTYISQNENRKAIKSLNELSDLKLVKDPVIYYNIGVLYSKEGKTKEAIKYYKKAIYTDSTHTNSYSNLASTLLSEDTKIVEEMNSLGRSTADNKRYNELSKIRKETFNQASIYLEKAIELKKGNDDLNDIKTLLFIYKYLEKTDDYNRIKNLLKGKKIPPPQSPDEIIVQDDELITEQQISGYTPDKNESLVENKKEKFITFRRTVYFDSGETIFKKGVVKSLDRIIDIIK